MAVNSRPSGARRRLEDAGGPAELQRVDVDSLLVAAVERLSEALDVLLRRCAKEHNLSPLQVRLLASLRHDGEARRRVRELARSCGAGTAPLRDAIAALESRGLVERPSGERDARTIRLLLTPTGRSLALTVSSWARPARKAIAGMPVRSKAALLPLLIDWVEALHRARIIAVARICRTCRFFARDFHPEGEARHHCQFFDQPLAEAALRVDCAEHRPL